MASPGSSDSLSIGAEYEWIVSVVWREIPHALLTYAEQSSPDSVFPPHT